MGVIAEGIPRGCQGLFTPVSLGYPLSVFNKNSTLKLHKIRDAQDQFNSRNVDLLHRNAIRIDCFAQTIRLTDLSLRVEFLLKTESGYLRDAEVT